MKDPYKVLGVSERASDDDIKQAYRDLAKKYHPDNYSDSPLADLAGEKMAEINAAYDTIQGYRKYNVTQQHTHYSTQEQYGQYGHNTSQGAYQGGGQFDDIRRLISAAKILEAEEVLNGVASDNRTAEWHFLKGNCLYKRGFLEDALGYIQKAISMDPYNTEYRMAADTLLKRQNYGYTSTKRRSSGCSPCAFCSALICADCACNICDCCF